MIRDELIDAKPYALAPAEKDPRFLAAMNELTAHHVAHSVQYARIVKGTFGETATRLEDVPWLPVSLFKSHDLRSVPQEEVFKVVASSGTTTGQVSRVVLDRQTASLQSKVLLHLLADLVGPSRLPLLIVDYAPGGGRAINARYAATVGIQPLGRDTFYCLDEQLRLDRDGLRAWLAKHPEGPILVFGFTFILWQSFLRELADGEIDLSRATLLHTGGWKRLEAEKIDNASYKEAFAKRTGLRRVHNFYGMAEQVGTVFVECEAGVLHAPACAEIIVRDERTWAPSDHGVIQVMSVLPTSYPGHSLLTEDLGRVIGKDGCACGRRGTHFVVTGRAPRAELRGCSDVRAVP